MMVPEEGVEPSCPLGAGDFESPASAIPPLRPDWGGTGSKPPEVRILASKPGNRTQTPRPRCSPKLLSGLPFCHFCLKIFGSAYRFFYF